MYYRYHDVFLRVSRGLRVCAVGFLGLDRGPTTVTIGGPTDPDLEQAWGPEIRFRL